MAPMISVSKNNSLKKSGINNNILQKERNKLIKLRNFIERNFEYVGKDFSKKVREIYYDKKNNKTIYGITSPEERKELKEEGIDLLTIPWLDKDN